MPRWVVLAGCGCIVFGYDGDLVDEVCDDIWESEHADWGRHQILCPLHGCDLPIATAQLGTGASILPEGYVG